LTPELFVAVFPEEAAREDSDPDVPDEDSESEDRDTDELIDVLNFLPYPFRSERCRKKNRFGGQRSLHYSVRQFTRNVPSAIQENALSLGNFFENLSASTCPIAPIKEINRQFAHYDRAFEILLASSENLIILINYLEKD